MSVRGVLLLPDGSALRIGHEGVLVGRHRTCDIQLTDVAASRRHALLRCADDAIELVQLGRHELEVNGKHVAPMHMLDDGDRIRFPGLDCRVRIEHGEDTLRVSHALRRGTERFPIHTTPFIVGSGTDARIVIATWPEAALRFQIAQGALFVEVGPGVRLNGELISEATSLELCIGDELELAGETIGIEEVYPDDASTERAHAPGVPTAIALAPLPRGGRVTFTFADGDRGVYLPGRRFKLISALATQPGELIADHDLIPLVWDDTDEVGDRQAVNVLITRSRQDLIAAGIAVAIERAPGGRATRLAVAPGARVTTAAD